MPGLIRTVTTCKKIPTTSHEFVELFDPSNVWGHLSTDCPYVHIQSSPSTYKRGWTLTLPVYDVKNRLLDVWRAILRSLSGMSMDATAAWKLRSINTGLNLPLTQFSQEPYTRWNVLNSSRPQNQSRPADKFALHPYWCLHGPAKACTMVLFYFENSVPRWAKNDSTSGQSLICGPLSHKAVKLVKAGFHSLQSKCRKSTWCLKKIEMISLKKRLLGGANLNRETKQERRCVPGLLIVFQLAKAR